MSDGIYTLDDFTVDGHLSDCDAGRLFSQSDEVPWCSCASLLHEVAAGIESREARRTPYQPPGLRALIESVTYKRGWSFGLYQFFEEQEVRGWTLGITSDTDNSLGPGRIRVFHQFLIPPASWNRDTWAAWIFDRVRDVETHEAGEFFQIDGVREFAPHHSNGEDPYRVWHVGDYATAAKSAGED